MDPISAFDQPADQLLKQGIAAFTRGDRAQARSLLGEAVRRNPGSEEAWLWLSSVVDQTDQRRMCLERALQINPANAKARELLLGLSATHTGAGVTTPLPSAAAAPQQPQPAPAAPLTQPLPAPSTQQSLPSTLAPLPQPMPAPSTQQLQPMFGSPVTQPITGTTGLPLPSAGPYGEPSGHAQTQPAFALGAATPPGPLFVPAVGAARPDAAIKKKIPAALYTIVFLCFFLPFTTVSCSGQTVISFSGWQVLQSSPSTHGSLATLQELGGQNNPNQAFADGDWPKKWPLIVTLLAAALGVGAALMRHPLGHGVAALAGLVATIGLLLYILLLTKDLQDALDTNQNVGNMRMDMLIQVSHGAGFWAALAACVLGMGMSAYLYRQQRHLSSEL